MGLTPDIPQVKQPPPPPDYADQAVRDAAASERTKQLTTASRRKSFVTGSGSLGAGGQPTIPVVDAKKLSGS